MGGDIEGRMEVPLCENSPLSYSLSKVRLSMQFIIVDVYAFFFSLQLKSFDNLSS